MNFGNQMGKSESQFEYYTYSPEYYACLMREQTTNLANSDLASLEKVQNQVKQLKAQLAEMKLKLQEATRQIKQLQQENHEDEPEYLFSKKKRRKFFKRKFKCPYDKCSREYGSSLALNLHIKQKHNGGTIKERETYAKLILMCEKKGQKPPSIDCDFPPGFLEAQRNRRRQQELQYEKN